MHRQLLASVVILTLTASTAPAQGPLQRVGQALDRAGKNIRSDVEGAIARGQVTAQERDLLVRVTQRINWDRQLVNSSMQLVVLADGTVYLRGSVRSDAAKARAADLAENTIGVTRVVDELAVVKVVKVIEPATVPPPPVTPVGPPVVPDVTVKPE